jgi:hypothetical protein
MLAPSLNRRGADVPFGWNRARSERDTDFSDWLLRPPTAKERDLARRAVEADCDDRGCDCDYELILNTYVHSVFDVRYPHVEVFHDRWCAVVKNDS